VRVVVIGATGNVGTSVLRSLAEEPAVDSVLGVARRAGGLEVAKVDWAGADVTRDELSPLLRGADAVVHLAWAIQPSHALNELWRTNVHGSGRLFRAVADAGVPALVYASSVGAYSPGPKDRRVDETWPTEGVETSFYARHKAEVERMLDRFEQELPDRRVVRLRPALTFQRDAAAGIRRLFAGPFLPTPLVRRGRVPAVPSIPGLRFQAVHSRDVGDAYRRAIVQEVRGAFNIAAEPVLDPPRLAELLRTRLVRISRRQARMVTAASWRLHLQPTPPGWLDLALAVPLMETARARSELGWAPRLGADEALVELLDGIADGTGAATPPLAPSTSGRFRLRERLTGVGRSSGE
jgi:UDP-glucose 4-epimerase